MRNLITVTLDSCYNDKAETKAFQKRMKADFNVDAKFHDGGDHYSSWTLTGTKTALKKVIAAEWMGGVKPSERRLYHLALGDLALSMKEDEFTAIYGAKAAETYLH